jgi:hypothetical protein
VSHKQTKRPPKGQKPAIKTLRQQMQLRGLFKEDLMKLEETEGPKLSAQILDLIEPYKSLATTSDAFEKLVVLGVVAWNAALLEGEERQALMEASVKAVVDTAGPQTRPDTQASLDRLLQRKLSLFPDDRRYIVDYRLTEAGPDIHLAVASLPKR